MMIRITCPQCHTRCRLQSDQEISDSSQGRCPECKHIFIIPPGVNREKSPPDKNSVKAKNAGLKPGVKRFNLKNFLASTLPPRTKARFWIFSGLSLAILLSAVFWGPTEKTSPRSKLNVAAKTYPSTPTEPTKLNLDPLAQAKAIAQIKHHALVGDADIVLKDRQLQLALLVADSTPVTYAERLGRQFAHYLKEQLSKTAPQKQPPSIEVSVYYPGGTRIEVATNDQNGEEEVLPK